MLRRSAELSEVGQRGHQQPGPARAQCTTSASGRRQLTVHPREVHQAQLAARATQATRDFQARYALR
ncbi:MAG: hypothetical protein JWM19_6005, partial [Actinomycetia bacterium]|nr:hypothetical protein [Actinomycetes bacterium]